MRAIAREFRCVKLEKCYSSTDTRVPICTAVIIFLTAVYQSYPVSGVVGVAVSEPNRVGRRYLTVNDIIL